MMSIVLSVKSSLSPLSSVLSGCGCALIPAARVQRFWIFLKIFFLQKKKFSAYSTVERKVIKLSEDSTHSIIDLIKWVFHIIPSMKQPQHLWDLNRFYIELLLSIRTYRFSRQKRQNRWTYRLNSKYRGAFILLIERVYLKVPLRFARFISVHSL